MTGDDRLGQPEQVARSRPSILAVTSQVPWPLDRGGHLRSYHLLRSLAGRFRLRLVAGLSKEAASDGNAFSRVGISLRSVELPSRTHLGEAYSVLSAAVRQQPYVCYRRHDRRAMRTAVAAELAREVPTLLYLDHLDSLLFADLQPGLVTVIDLHNVYSALVRRTAAEHSGVRRRYLLRESALLARREQQAAQSIDMLFAVSEDDCRHFQALGGSPVRVIPNGVDCATYAELPTGGRSGPPLILYVGTMSWGPNAAAAEHLVRHILPQVRAHVPDATVRVVGRDPSARLLALNAERGIEITGGVDDVRPHLRAAHVLAVPLEAGGGSRLKILEAFAAGLPVVSTPVGCEGLEVSSGRHLLIASRDQFADAVSRLLLDRPLADSLAVEGRELVKSRYTWDAIGQAACDAVGALLDRTGTPP